MSYEQLYQLQILELQRANLQLQLAASAAASQPHRLGNANLPQLSGRPYDTSGNAGSFIPANGGSNSGAPPNSQSMGYLTQHQPLHSPPQLFLPQIPHPPNLPSFPPLPPSPQPAPVLQQQHLTSPGPEAFHGSPQQTSSPDHALPGLGAIGALQQRYQRLAQQQAPAAQPPVPQSPRPVGTDLPPPPSSTIHQTSLASTMPAPIVGVSPTITPNVVRPTTASSTSSSSTSSSSSDSSRGGAGRVSTTASPPNTSTSAQATRANVAVSHQAIPIAAPQPLTVQSVNTSPSPLVTQAIDTASLSTTQTVNAATPYSPPPPASTISLPTPQNTNTIPSMHVNHTPVPIPNTAPVGAPSTTGPISSITNASLSFPSPSTPSTQMRPGASGTGSITPEKKKRQSWLRKLNFKKKSKD